MELINEFCELKAKFLKKFFNRAVDGDSLVTLVFTAVLWMVSLLMNKTDN